MEDRLLVKKIREKWIRVLEARLKTREEGLMIIVRF
jgi:hypothetical protein